MGFDEGEGKKSKRGSPTCLRSEVKSECNKVTFLVKFLACKHLELGTTFMIPLAWRPCNHGPNSAIAASLSDFIVGSNDRHKDTPRLVWGTTIELFYNACPA